jgi:hypothetical protein
MPDKKLSDNQVHDRLVAAERALGSDEAATVRGDTAITAARRALNLLQFGLVEAMERQTDTVRGVILPEEPQNPPEPRSSRE